MKPELRELLHHPRLWRGLSQASLSDQRTGFAELDRALPGRGWPRHALIELISAQPGIGELRLLLPSLREQTQCWIDPPHIPYPPALLNAGIDLSRLLMIQPDTPEDSLWALNQVLRSGHYPQVLAWSANADMSMLRRLQLAAEAGAARLFLFRPARACQQASPAALRLFLEPVREGLYLRILKSRGGQPASMILKLPDDDAMAVSAAATAATGRAASRAA